MHIRQVTTALFTTALLLLSACVVYEPVPVSGGPSKYDRAWNAALGGVQDAGLFVTAAEPNTGTIRGFKEGVEATVNVVRQADGSVRVQFDARDPGRRDPGLGERFSQAYERRMGR